MFKNVIAAAFAAAAVGSAIGSASADVVFESWNDNSFFTPFNSGNANSGIRYGDSGWLSGFQAETYSLTSVTLGMCVFDSATAGTTDIELVLTDGDRSGLVFGTAAELYRVTIPNIALPSTTAGGMVAVPITVPLPAVETLGGFNNLGWSIECSNFSYGGSFGFLCSSTSAQLNGFYTNNASFYNGSSWSLFSFGPDPTFGVANFVARFEIPAPGAAALLAIAMPVVVRRRR